MNTQGWIRGLIAHNSPLDKFISFVSNSIASEFNFKVELIERDDNYTFSFEQYKFEISKQMLNSLQIKGPYALDKYILGILRKQGFEFEYHRSQYIEYCYGLIELH